MGYQYTNSLNTGYNAGDWFSDAFLGTKNGELKNNLALMNEQNRFNEYMSSTQYQRAMSDMNAAGINPLVAFSNGASPNAAPSSGSGGHTSPFTGGILGKELANMVNEFNANLNGKNTDRAVSILGKMM